MKFETKPLTLAQRIELNNILEIETIYAIDGKTVKKTIVKNMFGFQAYAVQFGLKTLNGVEVTDQNREQIIHDLINTEIAKIADQVSDETNFSKKKKL
jgi:hypothetical protein